MSTLRVSEVFGPTLQGEGPSTGRLVAFLRLGGCNLSCPWCDTPYTWDWTGKNGTAYSPAKELVTMTTAEVVEALVATWAPRVVITGGEPLLQQDRLGDLLIELRARGIAVEVETNGTRVPSPVTASLVDAFNVSPKLGANTGMPADKRIVPEALIALARHPGAAFKFVVGDEAAVQEALSLVNEHAIPRSAVWFMPLAATQAELEAALPFAVEQAIRYGVNASGRLQVQTWGTRRGV